MTETGWFYSGVIDPILKPIRRKISNEIEPCKRLIDIACGTGAQVFEFAHKTSEAVGIDFSQSMINKAIQTKRRRNITNVNFLVDDATNISRFPDNHFDIATMSMALHQFDPELHSPILKEMKRLSKIIIIVDYTSPIPSNYSGFISKTAEFLAGKNHNKNFKEYCKIGGLNKILPQNNLKIKRSVLLCNGAFQLVICNFSK